MKDYYHIVWNIFGVYPLWDHKGDWGKLTKIYALLNDNNIEFESNKNLPKTYTKQLFYKEFHAFNIEQKEFLNRQINKLTEKNGDRICGNLEILYINVNNVYIELIVVEEQQLLKQKIARLKSRLATLLSFEFTNLFQGKNTWGKGVWISKIKNKQDQAVKIIKTNDNK